MEKQQEIKLLQAKFKGAGGGLHSHHESAASILHVDIQSMIPRGDEMFERDTTSQSVLVKGPKSKSERSSPLPRIQEVRKKHFPAIGNY